MVEETLFRLILVGFLAAFGTIRIAYNAASARKLKTASQESGYLHTLRLVCGLPGMLLVTLWLVQPAWARWSLLPLPAAWRWAGVALAPAALAFLWWVHHTLSTNFSPTLQLSRQHALVTAGPYRLIRHPMYTALLLAGLSAFLISANGWIGLISIPGMSLAVALRIPQEEAMMIARFGDQYRRYIQRTGRLLPRRLPSPSSDRLSAVSQLIYNEQRK